MKSLTSPGRAIPPPALPATSPTSCECVLRTTGEENRERSFSVPTQQHSTLRAAQHLLGDGAELFVRHQPALVDTERLHGR